MTEEDYQDFGKLYHNGHIHKINLGLYAEGYPHFREGIREEIASHLEKCKECQGRLAKAKEELEEIAQQAAKI